MAKYVDAFPDKVKERRDTYAGLHKALDELWKRVEKAVKGQDRKLADALLMEIEDLENELEEHEYD